MNHSTDRAAESSVASFVVAVFAMGLLAAVMLIPA